MFVPIPLNSKMGSGSGIIDENNCPNFTLTVKEFESSTVSVHGERSISSFSLESTLAVS